MTDTPKTLSLSAREWNVLLASNASDLAAVFSSQPNPSNDLYMKIVEHMDRMKAILPGWLAAAQAVPAGEAPVADVAPAAPVKRKGGWPAGKPRKARNGAQAVQ